MSASPLGRSGARYLMIGKEEKQRDGKPNGALPAFAGRQDRARPHACHNCGVSWFGQFHMHNWGNRIMTTEELGMAARSAASAAWRTVVIGALLLAVLYFANLVINPRLERTVMGWSPWMTYIIILFLLMLGGMLFFWLLAAIFLSLLARRMLRARR